MRLAYTQGILSNCHFVAFVMFLMAEWQLRYSSAPEETQSELADVEISYKCACGGRGGIFQSRIDKMVEIRRHL